mmetsp:Transcript_30607/g.64145  ORF Transcript_30607/g.64145 Transcript_30607/m.64145 type:complete len:87 (+) Transcript_30607:358-618(+)
MLITNFRNLFSLGMLRSFSILLESLVRKSIRLENCRWQFIVVSEISERRLTFGISHNYDVVLRTFLKVYRWFGTLGVFTNDIEGTT